MAKMTVKVTGIKELQKAIQEKRNEIYVAMRDAAIESSKVVQSDAEMKAPWRSGDLTLSIKEEIFLDSSAEGKIITAVTADADDQAGKDRAAFTELGTSDTEAKPFLRPSLRENKATIRNLFKSKIKAVIDR